MSLPYQPFYWGDYHRDTVGLKAEEHGAYLLLIGALWNAGGTLPADEDLLSRIACCTAGRWAKVWPRICVFFEIRSTAQGSWLEHKRVSADIEKQVAKWEQKSNAGKRGAAKKWAKNKGGSMAPPSVRHKQPEPEPIKTTTPLADRVSRAGLRVVTGSDDRRALEAYATMEAASATDSGGDNEDR